MKKILLIALVCVGFGIAGAPRSEAGGFSFGVSFGPVFGGGCHPAPVRYYTAPRYYAPPVYYYAPRPVLYYGQPVYHHNPQPCYRPVYRSYCR